MKTFLENDSRFSNTGITSTSANHITNMALEFIERKKSVLNELSFISSEVSVVTSDGFKTYSTSKGSNLEDFEKIDEYAKDIAEATTLVAYLREAIKYRQQISNSKISNMDLITWCKLIGEEYPRLPEHDICLTEDKYLESWENSKRVRYYRLQSLVSTYGDLIHKHGSFDKARNELLQKIQKPTITEGSGRDITIYTYSPIISEREVDEKYFALQASYRDAQKEFNSLKYEIELALDKDKSEKDEEYRVAVQLYSSKIDELTKLKSKDIRETLDKIRELKIVIPDNLKEIYNKVNSLSK